jgi:hypothetical protein
MRTLTIHVHISSLRLDFTHWCIVLLLFLLDILHIRLIIHIRRYGPMVQHWIVMQEIVVWIFFYFCPRKATNVLSNVTLRCVLYSTSSTSVPLKGQCHEIFCFRFFHESPSPKQLKITLGSFRFFSKIRGDIRKSRCTTGVNDTGGKFCHQFPLCCWHRWQICRRCQRRRWQIATDINDMGGK